MSAVAHVAGFFDRVGGVLVTPRRTLRGVAAGAGGLGDVMVLMALRVLAEQADVLARVVIGARLFGVRATLLGLVGAAAPLLPEVLGILVAAVALALACGKAARGRELDLAAFAWIPFLATRMAQAFVFTALGRAPSSVEGTAFFGVALGWSTVVLALAAITLRAEAAAAPAPEKVAVPPETAEIHPAPPPADVTEKGP